MIQLLQKNSWDGNCDDDEKDGMKQDDHDDGTLEVQLVLNCVRCAGSAVEAFRIKS